MGSSCKTGSGALNRGNIIKGGKKKMEAEGDILDIQVIIFEGGNDEVLYCIKQVKMERDQRGNH